MDGLVTEIHRLRSLKALLAVRDAAQGAYSRAWVAQDKLHFTAKQFRDKGRNDKVRDTEERPVCVARVPIDAAARVRDDAGAPRPCPHFDVQSDQLEPKIAEAVGICKRMKERLDDVTKGVLHVEADRVSRGRIDRALAMFGQYSALCIASGVRTQELWSGYLSANELDQATMVADAQATLTGQMSMHALDATGPSATLALPSSRLGPGGGTIRLPAGAGGGAPAEPVAAKSAPDGAPASGGAGGYDPFKAAPAPVAAPSGAGGYDPFGAAPAAPAPVAITSSSSSNLFGTDDEPSKEVTL